MKGKERKGKEEKRKREREKEEECGWMRIRMRVQMIGFWFLAEDARQEQAGQVSALIINKNRLTG